MTTTTKCPICNNQAKWVYWTESFGIVEEHIDCPHCGYYYEFAYGYYMECVNSKEFIWSYMTRYTNPIFNRMKRAEFMAKRNWKKFRKRG